jgi:uncharacterized membrane protein
MKVINEQKRNFGKMPLCNGKSERAPDIFGRCFFLCWRCTMVMIVSIISTIALYYIDLSLVMSKTFTIVGSILVLPMIFDGSIQYFTKRDSTNVRRVITGSLFGIGIAIVAFQVVEFIKC